MSLSPTQEKNHNKHNKFGPSPNVTQPYELRKMQAKRLLFLLETRKSNMGCCFKKHHPTHHHRIIRATHLYMATAILKSTIRLCKNSKIPYSRQTIRLYSRQNIQLCKGVIIPYVRTDTQNPQLQRRLYDRGDTWNSVLSSVIKTVRPKDAPRTN